MNEHDSEFVYTYSTEELDEIIGKIQRGIRVIMTPELESDLKLRMMELQQELMDEEDIEEFKTQRSELIKKKLEQKKRQATKNDIIIIQLSDDQKKRLEEEMSVSIVRPNPNLTYHKPDEELYDSEERREIYQKLSRVKQCYYDALEWKNAVVNIIMPAIMYSLDHDYPWLSREEAIKEFNKGHIRFEYCKIPKLYVNWTTTIEDPTTLRGIVNGTIQVIKNDESKKKKVKLPVEPMRYEVERTTEEEWNQMYALHQKGYNTPISPIIKASIGEFSRFALPSTNMFYQREKQKKREPIEFDWMQEDAGSKYYDLVHDVKYGTSELLDDLQTANNGNLNPDLMNAIGDFVKCLNNPAQSTNQLYQTTLVQTHDDRVVAMEQSILQQIKNSNPNR